MALKPLSSSYRSNYQDSLRHCGFRLTAGIAALGTMTETEGDEARGPRHARVDGRRGHRWGRTQGKIGFHAGKVAVERPRVRDLGGTRTHASELGRCGRGGLVGQVG